MATAAEPADSMSLFHAIVESNADGIVALDPAGKIIAYNSKFAKLWKFPPGLLERGDAAQARAHAAGMVKDPAAFLRLIGLESQASPERETLELLELKDGRTFERSCLPQWRGDAFTGVVIRWRDVTESKLAEIALSAKQRQLLETIQQLEQSENMLQLVIEAIPVRVFWKDGALRYLGCNSLFARDAGFSHPGELLGKDDSSMVWKAQAEAYNRDDRKVMQAGRPKMNIVEPQTTPSGATIWLNTSKAPLQKPDGEIFGILGVYEDITYRKKAEAELAAIHRELVEASRKAGMAEVATNVLLNVGNVLNSVNVSATVIYDRVKRTKAVSLAKLAALFDEHKAVLADFLTTDPRGQAIPSYLSALADSLSAEQQFVLGELWSLRKNIDHIKDIVSLQQDHAQAARVSETLPVTELIEDALRITAAALTRHGIEIVRDFEGQPVVTLDKHKLVQILVNLLSNAKLACVESGRADKRITVRLTCVERIVTIAIVDNGVGICAENMTQIFNHGFTTRVDGHGFGLHSCALYAKELHGSLRAHSDGPGKGATFELELPVTASSGR